MNHKQYVENLSDDALTAAIDTCKRDLEKAAEEQHGSEWHEACFAGIVVLTNEAARRKVT